MPNEHRTVHIVLSNVDRTSTHFSTLAKYGSQSFLGEEREKKITEVFQLRDATPPPSQQDSNALDRSCHFGSVPSYSCLVLFSGRVSSCFGFPWSWRTASLCWRLGVVHRTPLKTTTCTFSFTKMIRNYDDVTTFYDCIYNSNHEQPRAKLPAGLKAVKRGINIGSRTNSMA